MLAVILYLAIPLICLLGVRRRTGKENILDRDATLAMRGLGMLLIIYTHLSQRNLCAETYFFYLSGVVGVAICFFVSGYGLHISYKTKNNYLAGYWFPKIMRLALPFWMTLVLSWVIAFACGETVTLSSIAESLLTVTLPGATLWYLKIQLLMYAIFYCAYRFAADMRLKLAAVFLAAAVYFVLAAVVGLEMFWYNSCLFFPLGLLFAEYQQRLLPIVRSKWFLIITGSACAGIYGILYFFGRLNMDLLIDNAYMLCSCAVLLWAVQTFTGLRALEILGKYSIEVYLLHIIIRGQWFAATNPYAYILTPLACVLIGIPVHWGTDRLMAIFYSLKRR